MNARRPHDRRSEERPDEDGAPIDETIRGEAPETPDADADASPSEPASPEERVAQLERELADAKDLRLRAIADYQNAQRRMGEQEQRGRTGGVSFIARHVIPVLDHFDLALAQSTTMTAESAVEGVRMLQSELAKALEKSGIERIEPKAGDDFDPHRHEAVMRQPAEGVETDRISVVFQPGYRLGDTVIRPAKVAVAP